MGRKKRVWYPGAQYHIMIRGNRRADLFRENKDFIEFISILLDTKDRYPFRLYAYCLMDNHVHLQIKTEKVSISRIMHQINTIYSKYFNDEYNMIGHTFQDRYRAELIKSDSYMLQTNRYIHKNPVAAKMVKMPQDYRWSSYSKYVYQTDGHLVDHEDFLKRFQSIESFMDFTEDAKVYMRDLEIESLMEDY